MTETKIYVGLNDATTKQQEHNTEMYVDIMKYICQSYHVAFSFVVTEGGYFHEDGDYTQEQTLVLSLIDAEKHIAEAIARDLISAGYADGVVEDEDKRDNTRADTKPVARKRTGSKRK